MLNNSVEKKKLWINKVDCPGCLVSFSYHFFRFAFLFICLGLQTCDDSRFFTTELKPRVDIDQQCHWGVPQGSHSQLNGPFPTPVAPTVHHSILHHPAPPAGGPAYDTLSLESSDSMETSISTGNNSTCSPERWETEGALHRIKHIGLVPKHLNLVWESGVSFFQIKDFYILTFISSISNNTQITINHPWSSTLYQWEWTCCGGKYHASQQYSTTLSHQIHLDYKWHSDCCSLHGTLSLCALQHLI